MRKIKSAFLPSKKKKKKKCHKSIFGIKRIARTIPQNSPAAAIYCKIVHPTTSCTVKITLLSHSTKKDVYLSQNYYHIITSHDVVSLQRHKDMSCASKLKL